MLEYEEFKHLFKIFKVLMMPCKHWSNSIGWTFVDLGTWKCYTKPIE